MVSSSSKPILVIGGATGYAGKLLAFEYAKNGFDLILLGRDIEKLEILSDRLEKECKVIAKPCRISGIQGISDLLDGELEKFKDRIFFFINTIGVQSPMGPLLESESESWVSSIETNLTLPTLLTKYFGNVIAINGHGSIVLFSGGGASQARENFSAYSAAKAGLVRMVETFAKEMKSRNVRVNAVAPGVMPSKMMVEIIDSKESAGQAEWQKASTALDGDNFDSVKMIDLCKFLTSNESVGISGKLISAEWDNWREWPNHLEELQDSDLYTLRRITSRDRGMKWGDY
jgi:3-oxoacyl-[acyl-carrier protein] reductase